MKLTRFILKLILSILISNLIYSFQSNAESLESLQAKLNSMQACKESIEDKRCNLKILDPELRESLIQLDKLKQGSRNSSNRKIIGGNVQFFTDSIWSVNSNIVKLLGGSTWRLDSNFYVFASQEMIGIKNGSNSAVFYVDGNTSNATLISGIVSSNSAILTDVISSKADGRILKLSNGMVLEFDSYDAYDTGWWLPSYPVLVESSGMNMWNLNKGKKFGLKVLSSDFI